MSSLLTVWRYADSGTAGAHATHGYPKPTCTTTDSGTSRPSSRADARVFTEAIALYRLAAEALIRLTRLSLGARWAYMYRNAEPRWRRGQ